MDDLRRLRYASIGALVLFPIAAWLWLSGPVEDSRPWWVWLAVGACVTVFLAGTARAHALCRDGTFGDADRRVWRGGLRVAGPLAAPFVLRAAERRAASETTKPG